MILATLVTRTHMSAYLDSVTKNDKELIMIFESHHVWSTYIENSRSNKYVVKWFYRHNTWIHEATVVWTS